MCTVTFISRKTGYLVGMNRDEKLTRVAGLPPRKRIIDGRIVTYPSEPTGGTWISLNDAGVTFALINWYSVLTKPKGHWASRGEIIPSICTALGPHTIDRQLAALPLKSIKPFRLIGIFKSSHQVKEWQWDLKRLLSKDHEWKPQQWISSSFDEPSAQKIRGRTFREFRSQAYPGTINWLRRLHSSHSPSCGPFSTCMHRDDATTVSYTEICVSSGEYFLSHLCNSLCQSCTFHSSRFDAAAKNGDSQDCRFSNP